MTHACIACRLFGPSHYLNQQWIIFNWTVMNISQIAKFIGPTWGPPGSCRPQMGPMNLVIRDTTVTVTSEWKYNIYSMQMRLKMPSAKYREFLSLNVLILNSRQDLNVQHNKLTKLGWVQKYETWFTCPSAVRNMFKGQVSKNDVWPYENIWVHVYVVLIREKTSHKTLNPSPFCMFYNLGIWKQKCQHAII